jgi:hypothetical protein
MHAISQLNHNRPMSCAQTLNISSYEENSRQQTHNQILEIEHNKIKIRGGSQIMSAISLHRQFKSLTSLANNVTSLNNHHHLDLNHMTNHDPTVQNHRSKVLHAPVSRNLHKRGCTKVGGSRKPQKRLHSSKEGLVS